VGSNPATPTIFINNFNHFRTLKTRRFLRCGVWVHDGFKGRRLIDGPTSEKTGHRRQGDNGGRRSLGRATPRLAFNSDTGGASSRERTNISRAKGTLKHNEHRQGRFDPVARLVECCERRRNSTGRRYSRCYRITRYRDGCSDDCSRAKSSQEWRSAQD
jgi:hypothetical protein